MRVAPPPVDWLPTGLERITLKKLMQALTRAMERLPAETAITAQVRQFTGLRLPRK